jgi:hypothetical protein
MKFLSVSIIFLLLILSCSKKKEDTTTIDCSTPSSFSANVSPLMQSSCALSGCHNAGSTNGPGALTNYTQIFSARAAIRSAVSSGKAKGRNADDHDDYDK